MSRYVAYAFVFLSLAAANAFADGKHLSLKDAVHLALTGNHELRAYKYSVSAGREDIGIARSLLLPKISFEERFLRSDNPTVVFSSKLNQERFAAADFVINSLNAPRAVNDFQTSVSFEQPIFFRKAWIGLTMADKEYSAKSGDYERKREETAFHVMKTYIAVVTAKEFVRAAEGAVADAKEHLRIAELRDKTGIGLYSDMLRASTGMTGAEQMLISAQKNFEVAKRALGLLLGMSESIDADDGIPEIRLMDIDYYTRASLDRKDIRSLEKRCENSKNAVKLAEAGYIPVLGIGGAYQMNDHRSPLGSEGESYQVMAFLKWDLFDGTKREHERTRAKYQASEAEEQLAGLKKAVSFDVYEAYLTVKEAEKNVELSRSALKTAEEGKRLVKLRYENLLSPIVDLLDVQAGLDHSRAGLVEKENTYRIAIANLAFESGTILRDLEVK